MEKVITVKSGKEGGRRKREGEREGELLYSFEELPDFYSDSRLYHMI